MGICRYAGITMEVFEEVYAHHHPDYMDGVREAVLGRRERAANPQQSPNDWTQPNVNRLRRT